MPGMMGAFMAPAPPPSVDYSLALVLAKASTQQFLSLLFVLLDLGSRVSVIL